MLFILIPIIWLAVLTLATAACRVAGRADQATLVAARQMRARAETRASSSELHQEIIRRIDGSSTDTMLASSMAQARAAVG